MHELKNQLQSYLAARWQDYDSISVENLQDLPGGYSKNTIRFDAVLRRGEQATTLPLVFRCDKPAASAIQINSRENEHVILQRLKEFTSVPVPKSYFVEMNPSYFGQPAMIMERIVGRTDPGSLFQGAVASDEARRVARDLCERLAVLHTADVSKLNSDGRFSDPKGAGILTDSWEHYIDSMRAYFKQGYHSINYDAMPVFYDVILHLSRHRPHPVPLSIVHGENHPNNLIFQDGKVAAIVDWETAHVGDPREDLGYFRFLEGLTGTHFASAVDFPGGFLGYYNHLTGFNVTQADLDYFQLFSTCNIMMQIFGSVKRRVQRQHLEILPMYLTQPVVAGTAGHAQLMSQLPSAQG